MRTLQDTIKSLALCKARATRSADPTIVEISRALADEITVHLTTLRLLKELEEKGV